MMLCSFRLAVAWPGQIEFAMLTLRQIEVIRAVMLTGTIAGAARLLNVAAPGSAV